MVHEQIIDIICVNSTCRRTNAWLRYVILVEVQSFFRQLGCWLDMQLKLKGTEDPFQRTREKILEVVKKIDILPPKTCHCTKPNEQECHADVPQIAQVGSSEKTEGPQSMTSKSHELAPISELWDSDDCNALVFEVVSRDPNMAPLSKELVAQLEKKVSEWNIQVKPGMCSYKDVVCAVYKDLCKDKKKKHVKHAAMAQSDFSSEVLDAIYCNLVLPKIPGTKKSEAAKATDSITASPDTAKLMAAIANSEKTAVAKITILETKVESKEQLEDVRTEFGAMISPLDASIAENKSRLTSLESATNVYSDRVVDLEKEVRCLKETVTTLSEKTEDLEGRQRRCNIRILGVKEQFEAGTQPVTSVAKLLQEVLGMDAVPTLDRAHRSLQPVPPKGQRPWPFVVKFHYYQEKLEVLRRAARNGPLFYHGDKILIFPDLPPTVAKRRGSFKEVKELLRGLQGVKYGMLYPAKLRVSSPLGERVFTDPGAAKDYVTKHLVGRGQEDENED
ncbi:hypothetical protein WMY93_013726 [Mugilogobius chulae]|uniref:L1 transposable element RRM domain-containing protein n=1 Tax=Mugilogobius chulae TaxID=88201 RepID=A0AAW0P9X4_9GOBI